MELGLSIIVFGRRSMEPLNTLCYADKNDYVLGSLTLTVLVTTIDALGHFETG